MLRFAAGRLLRAAVTILMVVAFSFVVLRLSGDPSQIILGADAPPEAVDAFRTAWGLDRPLWVQFFSYFGAILSGDLGRSMRDGREAIVLVTERIPSPSHSPCRRWQSSCASASRPGCWPRCTATPGSTAR
jgi:peptide/nickel transport system permease protein